MEIPIYQIDAFAGGLFRGNPAAVCPLEEWLPDAVLQAIAAENNLAETAFYVRDSGRYRIRWFTPKIEVDLCGHATLATAVVILDVRKEVSGGKVSFHSRSGELAVERSAEVYTLDFPSQPAAAVPGKPDLAEALGALPAAFLKARYDLCVFETEAQIRALAPDMRALGKVDTLAVIVTAPGNDCDFVSRFFAPGAGIDEDPVTGSAHSTLIPFGPSGWGKRSCSRDRFRPAAATCGVRIAGIAWGSAGMR